MTIPTPKAAGRSVNAFVLRSVSILLLAALLVPTIMFGEMPRAKAATPQSPANFSLPTAAPPESFIIPGHPPTITSTAMLTTLYAGVSDVLVAKAPEPGFEILGTPTFAERLTNLVSPLFAFASTNATDAATATPPPPAGSVEFDFDNDGKADIARWHAATAEFKIKNSGSGSYSTYTTLGTSASKPAPGDYDGDGATDAGVFDAGTFSIRKSSNGAALTIILGGSGDIPAVGDYDTDGKSDAAVFRPSTGTWYVKRSSDGVTSSTTFGQSGDIPVAGNYDGDSTTDIAVFRPSTGTWYVQASTAGLSITAWGLSTDIPVPADYDGDNKTDLAVYRGSTGVWWVLKSSNGGYITQAWGNYGDQPVPANYDNDNLADFSVWRPTTGVWHTLKSSTSTYDYETLGVPGDFAVTSAYVKQIGGVVSGSSLAKARLAPGNATGGTDLYSRNFAWGTSLVGLPGRAGLDAGFGIGYNSLVWTRDGSSIYFDTNNDNISPGFRFGYATIEPAYYDSTTAKWNYLMVTPSGARTEFRQTTVSNVYETADSSYAQLVTTGATNPNDPVEDIKLTVTTTDGTRTAYEWKAGAFRCKEVKDRNGNYVTINHDDQGLLRTVTDTLGRVITVNYDTQLYPTSITQMWKDNNGQGTDTPHTWASFAYTTKTIDTDFALSAVFGPPDGTVLRVLERVTYADGSSTRFTHNGYAQVFKIANHAPDGSFLNHVRTNLETVTGAQTDCPRLAQAKTKVANFNGDAETIVDNTLATGHSVADIDGATVAATLLQVSMQNHPTGNVTNTYVHPTGWREGLPIRTDDYSNETGLILRRSSFTKWTQDDPNASYILNPRVTESKVSDGANTKRSTVTYLTYPLTTVAQYGLVSSASVYDTDLSTELKRVETDYNLSSTYTDRRIIGLPSETRAYGRETSGLNLMSKTTYAYDEGNFSDTTLSQSISPTQHDTTNLGASFIAGRGNLTSTTRWNVEYPTSSAYAITSSVKYNTAGSPVAQITPWDGTYTRTVRIGYADNFNTTGNPATYAYPTVMTDAAGTTLGDANHSSTVKYRYDTGANVWAKSPDLNAQTPGKQTEREYDEIGRLLKDKVVNLGGAYIRYEYFDNGVRSKAFSTIVDTNNNNVADTADEVLSESWSDGAGRTRMSRTEHPGSLGGYAGSLVEYDILGRVKRSTVPTELNASWQPHGDDYRGMIGSEYVWLWTHQKYDWMGRVVRKIATDGIDQTTLNDSDILISYEGCGCAGGLVTTIQSENVPRDDQPTVNARRTQKIYADILGRQWKTVVYKWDGTTAYTTTEQTFNGRDQVVKTKQIDNTSTVTPQTYQEVTMTFDGHGRMKTRHYPIEDALAATTWNYNPDSSISQTIDPRGAIADFTYNSRGLTTQIAYTPPSGTSVPDTPTVDFGYDNLGNRVSMSDGTGTSAYSYNELSQMTSETKTFSGLTGNFTVGYAYHIGGGLKSVTDPFQSTVDYAHDRTGRLTSVLGTPFGNNTTGNYVDQIQYRAFGSIKQMNYKTDDNPLVSMQYDNRLRVSSYQVASSVVSGGFVQKAAYEYNADSRPKAVDNVVNGAFDQTFKYDFAERLTANYFGIGTRPDSQQFTTYSQTIQYDAFSNMTARQAGIWSGSEGFTASYVNGRRQANSGETLTFDALGNVVEITYPQPIRVRFERSKFDAAGRMAEFSKRQQHGGGQTTFHDITKVTTQSYDGDGERVRQHERTESTQAPAPPGVPQPVVWEEVEYYVRSSVTGKVITQLNAAGGKAKTRVYMGSALLAEQHVFPPNPAGPGWNEVVWQHGDPVTGSSVQTWKNGALSMYAHGRYEREPLGGIVPTYDPYYQEDFNIPEYEWGGDVRSPEWGCTLPDIGVPAPCNVAGAYMNHLERLQFTLDRINANHSRLGKFTRPTRPWIGLIPGFIGADEWPDDYDMEQIPGVRIARTEYVDDRAINIWAVDNSTAAQTQESLPSVENNDEKFLARILQDVKDILSKDSDCSRFFNGELVATVSSTENGKSSVQNIFERNASLAVDAFGKSAKIGFLDAASVDRSAIGIQMSGGQTITYDGTTTFRSWERVKINSRGIFMTSGRFGSYSGRAGRALAILHEIAHMIRTGGVVRDKKGRVTDYTHLIPDDHDKTTKSGENLSTANTELIEQKCKKELDDLNAATN